jgi:hypothetical protein
MFYIIFYLFFTLEHHLQYYTAMAFAMRARSSLDCISQLLHCDLNTAQISLSARGLVYVLIGQGRHRQIIVFC